MPRNYNFIYKKLVEDSNDIVGHIAYALYKADKIRFIEDFKRSNNEKEPNEADLEPFHRTSCLDGSLERYKLTATTILQGFLDYSLEEATKQIEDECVNSHKSILESVIKPLKPMKKSAQFWFGVGQSIVGAFFFAFILAGIGLITVFKTNDINVTISTPKSQDKATTNHESLNDTIDILKRSIPGVF